MDSMKEDLQSRADISQWSRCNIACYFTLLGFNEYYVHKISTLVASGSELLALAAIMDQEEDATVKDTVQYSIREMFVDDEAKLTSFCNAIRTLVHYQNKRRSINDFFLSITQVQDLIDSLQYRDHELSFRLRSKITKDVIHGSCLLATSQPTLRSWFRKDQDCEFNQLLSAINTLRYQHGWTRTAAKDAEWQWSDVSPRRNTVVPSVPTVVIPDTNSTANAAVMITVEAQLSPAEVEHATERSKAEEEEPQQDLAAADQSPQSSVSTQPNVSELMCEQIEIISDENM
jgi:hypothetical protein